MAWNGSLVSVEVHSFNYEVLSVTHSHHMWDLEEHEKEIWVCRRVGHWQMKCKFSWENKEAFLRSRLMSLRTICKTARNFYRGLAVIGY